VRGDCWQGLTFDSGGLNIKGAGSGIVMKVDMGGAAATLGAAKAIAALKPDVEVHFVAVTENMISGRAVHPGDILTASNGKTKLITPTPRVVNPGRRLAFYRKAGRGCDH